MAVSTSPQPSWLRQRLRASAFGGPLRHLSNLTEKVVFPAIALLIYPFAVLLRPFVLVRVTPIPSKRLGHLSLRSALYLAERQAGLHPRRSFDIFFLRPSVPSNAALVRVLKRSMRIWQFARFFYRINRKMPGGAAHLGNPLSLQTGDDIDVFGLYNRTDPGVFLLPEEIAAGWKVLSHQGVPEEAPFICFHARDKRYLTELYRGPGENLEERHDYRNADIRSYLPAVSDMAERGYFAFRMGALVDAPLPEVHPRVVDYATQFRSEEMDVFLLSKCRFIVACGSGPEGISILFRRPVVFVQFPTVEQIHSSLPHVTILKRYWSEREQRCLTWKEVIERGLGDYMTQSQMDSHGIKLLDNTTAEVQEAVQEMDARLDGRWQDDPVDLALQERFWSLLEDHPLHQHRCGYIGAAFLRRHRDLLADVPDKSAQGEV